MLERQGRRHQVNVAGSRAVMCEPATRITGTVRQPMSARGLDEMTMLARQDLANRLHLDVQHVRVVSMEPRRWTDDDMNCSSGVGAARDWSRRQRQRARHPASAIALRSLLRTARYFYHTDLRSVRACPPIEVQ